MSALRTPQAPAAEPSGMERAQALAEQVRAQAIERETQALSEAATREALRELQAQPGGAESFQVGPGGEIIPGPPPPPPPDAIGFPGEEGPPDFAFPDFPEEIMFIAIAFFVMIGFIAVGLPIARAYARRLDRRPAPEPASAAQTEQLREIRTAVEAMAIEVERISENQRFVTRLLSEGEGGARPLAVSDGVRVAADRAREPR